MPTCQICHAFYVRPQTFESLFNETKLCDVCVAYERATLSLAVIPLEATVMEVCHLEHAGDHPALTRRFFKHLIKERGTPYLFDRDETPTAEALRLLGALGNPLRLYASRALDQKTLAMFGASSGGGA